MEVVLGESSSAVVSTNVLLVITIYADFLESTGIVGDPSLSQAIGRALDARL